ncbi:MAG TPA: 1,4-alpha-glucan branching protein domain-containing protein [Planctomycetota bacterium]|nr:1,4-alpha-glucan branching protein domain-containing protein [Planctomycetota bacterium]
MNADPAGYLSLVLHAHLPFVRHPEHPRFLEEDWLYEAIGETYIPLARMMERLLHDGVKFRLTMTLSPPLCEMLVDPLLQSRYRRHADELLETVRKDRGRLEVKYQRSMDLYERTLSESLEYVQRNDLLQVFRRLQETGSLEIVTCGATHGFLPFVLDARPQVRTAVANYKKHFGRPPRGIWLPECAFAPGLDRILVENGIEFFYVDAHGILNGSRVPRYGIHAPIRTPAGCAVFGRDTDTSKQVWSAKEGYPGDPAYREFYRDLGFDLGLGRNLGIKCHRITGEVPLHLKEPYDPEAARAKASEHAFHFKFNRELQARYLKEKLGRVPVIVAPYDAELFGHWWFEGPLFLEALFRAMADSDVQLTHAPEVLARAGALQTLEPAASSWGDKGYYEVWLNSTNDWIYRHQRLAEERMAELAAREGGSALEERALTQAAREVLLLQSSDWAFIMDTGAVAPYAHKRFKEHTLRFTRLWEMIGKGAIDETFLGDCEAKDSIFQELDYRNFRSSEIGE